MIVYCIENVVSGKRYVGVTTTTPLVRWNSHVKRALNGKKSKTALSCAIRKYGPESFAIEEIASLADGTMAELFDLEKTLIRLLCTKVPHGYNMTDGGDGTVGYRFTEEQKAKVSLRIYTPATRARMAKAQTGRRHTAEAKRKIGAAASTRNKGRKHPNRKSPTPKLNRDPAQHSLELN